MPLNKWHLHFIEDPIYKFRANFVYGLSYAQFVEYANKCTGNDMQVETGVTNGCFYHDDEKGWFILWLPLKVKKDVIAHEMVHLVMRMLYLKNVPTAVQNEETFAYHLQWWYKEVNRCIAKSK